MNVSLTKELERQVRKRVASGMYTSASEVMREALRLMDARDRTYATRLKELRRELDIGMRELDRGEGRPFDAARVRRIIAEVAARKASVRKSA